MFRMRLLCKATLFALPALLLGAALAAAFTLSGTVTSGGKPVVGAAVRVLDLDRIERSGPDGAFAFRDVPNGKYRVFAGLIGFSAVTNEVTVSGADATTSFELKATAIPLEEIVVSASPYSRPADEQYQSAESRSQVTLLNSAGGSVADKLSDLPGVAVRGNGTAPNRPILRGLSDNRVLLLEDGLRNGDIATYDPAHATPVEAIGVSQVDVVRGPASILYGPSTIGGLVNVITNIVPEVSDHRVSGTAAVEGNSVSDQYAGFFNTIFSGRSQAFKLSAGGLHSNDVRIPSGTYVDPASGAAFDLNRQPQTFDHSWEAGAGYALQGATASMGLGWKHYEMNYGIPGVPPNDDWIDVPPATSRIAQKRNTFELQSQVVTASGFAQRWKLDANFNDYGHSEFPTAQDSTGVSDPQANHFHKRAFNGTLQLLQRPIGRLQGTLGLWTDIEDLAISGDQPLGPNSLTTGFAAYAFEELQAGVNTRLQAGLRYDLNRIKTRPYALSTDSVFQSIRESRDANAVTASLGLIQRFSSELNGTVSLARSFRAPTVQELFANGLDAASGTYSVGTSTLGPETGFGIDASLKGNFERAAFEISPYANFISDYIYGFLRGDTILAFPVRQFAATDARLVGFEASVTVEPAAHFALRAQSDYVNAEDTKANVPLPFTPPLRGLVRATWQDDRRSAMVEWRGAAKQDRLGDGDTPTKAWALLNVGVGIRFVHEGWVSDLGLHCDNVLDTAVRDNLSVIKDFIPGPGRGFRLNYEVSF